MTAEAQNKAIGAAVRLFHEANADLHIEAPRRDFTAPAAIFDAFEEATAARQNGIVFGPPIDPNDPREVLWCKGVRMYRG